MKTWLLACLFSLVIGASALAQSVTSVIGGAVDATVFPCETFAFSEDSAITFPSSTLQVPFSLSINLKRNLWTAAINTTGSSNLTSIYTGTLSPLALVGTSTAINSGIITNFARAVIDDANGYVINPGDSLGPCGASCYQFRNVDPSAVLNAPIQTNVVLTSTTSQGITQSAADVFISADFGATGAGHVVGRFPKSTGLLNVASGGENQVGASNGPLVYDDVNQSVYSTHALGGGVNQLARYNTNPLSFVGYVTSTAEVPRAGFTVNARNQRLYFVGGTGGLVIAYAVNTPALTANTSVTISTGGSGDVVTQNMLYDPLENRLYFLNGLRVLRVLNPLTLATVTSYTDATATTIFPSVMNGLQIDVIDKFLYYFRENAGSSVQLVKLRYCS